MPQLQAQRFAYIDWLRGMACLGMFEVHCYDSWLSPAARKSAFFGWSQFSGTIPAPLFVFLSGVASALVADRMRRKGVPSKQIATRMTRRGAEILALALLFRVQEFVLGWPAAPRTDLLRVDVLNLIGVSVILMGVFCWIMQRPSFAGIGAACISLTVALLTPLLWTSWRPRWLPWYLESYINGVHIYDAPQPWLFPLFPWAAFAFAGLAIGFLLFSDRAMRRSGQAMGLLAVGGAGIFFLSRWFDASPIHLYSVYDYWHTSPNFFLARLGLVLVVMFVAYAWCRWGFGAKGFSPWIQLGQTSLIVYWVHTELVYGRFTILDRHAQSIAKATLGLVVITIAMVLLSMLRARLKGRGKDILAWLKGFRSEEARRTQGAAEG